MKVGELRKRGFKAIAGDTLTNGLPDSIKLSIGGAISVNEGHHDELEIVDLRWRVGSPPDSFRGTAELFGNGWRHAFNQLPDAAKLYKDDTQCFVESVPKVPSDKMQEALKEADAISEGFLSNCVEVPAKPIFTQAMADAGELPPINAECNICYENDGLFFKGSVIAYLGDLLWLDLGDKNPVRMTREVKFKPLDNRTEKQKAVDAAIAEWPVADKATLEFAYDLWAQKIEQ